MKAPTCIRCGTKQTEERPGIWACLGCRSVVGHVTMLVKSPPATGTTVKLSLIQRLWRWIWRR